jgi:hypothetical protein
VRLLQFFLWFAYIDRPRLSDEAQVIKEIVPIIPEGPLTGNIYILKSRRGRGIMNLRLWARSADHTMIDQKNSLLPNGLCHRCDEIASRDLERLRSLRLESSQTVVIRLAKADTRCRSCEFFARWKLTRYDEHQTRDYFLVGLAAVNLDIRPVQGRHCIVTDYPALCISSYEHQDQFYSQHLMFPMDTVTLCSQDGIRHLPFGHDEYESISQWLRTCLTDHSKECPQTSVRNTLTVYCIDCHDERVVPIPHAAKYVALSYVWGDTTAPDDDESLSDAPPIVKDAMIATLSLRFRYLWVDRYCINQHDLSQKHQQIANMGNIYAGATLTFIAAGDVDLAVGLPGVSSCRCGSDAEFQLGPYSFMRFFGDPEAEIGSSKWATRGWTYQEAVMSPRKLVFTSNGFYTQCNIQHSFGNSHPINGQSVMSSRRNTMFGMRSSIPGPSIATTVVFPDTYTNLLVPKPVLGEFFDHISKYIRRHLSYESDRLNAIQGVLNEFRSNKEPLFQIFGVPFSPASQWTINETLFWRMQNHSVQRRTDFPSWSWLGWQYICEIPRQPFVLCGLEHRNTEESYSHPSYGTFLSHDQHSARISVEFLSGGLLNLTKRHHITTLETALPQEARIMPHLVICGIILPFVLERDETNNWVHINPPDIPFQRTNCLFPFKFRMWLDVPEAQAQDAFRQDQVRELFLGRFDAAIRVLILRENGDA